MQNLADAIKFHHELEKALKTKHEQLVAEKLAVQAVRARVLSLRQTLREQANATEQSAIAVHVELARQKEAEDAIERLKSRHPQILRTISEMQAERRVARATIVDLMVKRLEILAGPLGQQSRALAEAMSILEREMQLLDDQHQAVENLATVVRPRAGQDQLLPQRQEHQRTLEERWVQLAASLDDLSDKQDIFSLKTVCVSEKTQPTDLEKDLENRLAHQRRRNALIAEILNNS